MLRGHRAWLRKRTANLRRRIDRADAWAALLALLRGRVLRAARISVVAWMIGAVRENHALVAELRDTKSELRSSLRKDRLLWIQQTAKAACDAPVKNVVQRLRPLLGPPRRGRAQAGGLPAVLKLDGTLAQDPEEIRERWIEHFASNEGGRRCSTSDLIAACQFRQQQQRLEVLTIAAGELPSRLCLEAAFRDCATGRAIGPDGLPAEVLHYGAGGIAAPVYQLLLKTVLRLEEPLAWKGGLIHSLWKGKIAPHLCHGHRSILISSTVGKAVHRTLRGLGIAPLNRTRSELQVGGLPRHPVLVAAHAARMFASCHKSGSCFLLFLDVREAFYRVARPLLVRIDQSEEEIARVFRDLNLPAEAYDDFCKVLAGETAIGRTGASEWLQAVYRELMSNTWFRLPHQEDVVVTSLGT